MISDQSNSHALPCRLRRVPVRASFFCILSLAGIAGRPEAADRIGEPKGGSAPFSSELAPARPSERRRRLLEALPEGIVMISASISIELERYRESPNFLYFAGHELPGATVVFRSTKVGRNESILFLPKKNSRGNQWLGEPIAVSGDSKKDGELALRLGVDRVEPSDTLEPIVSDWAQGTKRLHLPFDPRSSDDPAARRLEPILRALRRRRPALQLLDARGAMAALRLEKDEDEIASIRKAVDVTADAHRAAAQTIRPGVNEGEIDGLVYQKIRAAGAERLGFASIVGSGVRAAILHYNRNLEIMPEGELVVVDIGASWGNYSADLTRTYPVSGKFSKRQRELYEVVLGARRAALDSIRPGKRIHEDIHQAAVNYFRRAGYEKYFTHGTSHYLGLEVHDPGDYSHPLTPGVVLTIEPGVYLPEEHIGIRIEDDVLVTEGDPIVLSSRLPVEAEEIERMMAAGK